MDFWPCAKIRKDLPRLFPKINSANNHLKHRNIKSNDNSKLNILSILFIQNIKEFYICSFNVKNLSHRSFGPEKIKRSPNRFGSEKSRDHKTFWKNQIFWPKYLSIFLFQILIKVVYDLSIFLPQNLICDWTRKSLDFMRQKNREIKKHFEKIKPIEKIRG